MKIMITGANGQVGFELQRVLPKLGEVFALDRAAFDLSRPELLPGIIRKISPDVILNTAAYTEVDRAEGVEALATAINGAAVGVMAREARTLGALLVHYSTDYVFDGSKSSPYEEADGPRPLNAYGRSKLAGDIAVQDSGAPHLILRTSWVYSSRGRNFMKTIMRLVQERPELTIVNDQIGAPTWARRLALVTSSLVDLAIEARRRSDFKSSIVNVAAAGVTSWYGFAEAILAEAPQELLKPPLATLRPISSDDYVTAAMRPRNSRLSTRLLTEQLGVPVPFWRDDLRECLCELAADRNPCERRGSQGS